jgi:hypothetical protein
MPSQSTIGITTREEVVFREFITVWLTPRLSYSLDFETVKITSVGELKILGYHRNLKEYINWRMGEARLVIRDGKAFLKFEKE